MALSFSKKDSSCISIAIGGGLERLLVALPCQHCMSDAINWSISLPRNQKIILNLSGFGLPAEIYPIALYSGMRRRGTVSLKRCRKRLPPVYLELRFLV
jgi:hypothetical protein